MKQTLALVFAAVVLLLNPVASKAADASADDTYRLLNLFGDVFERVRSDYVEQVSDKDLIEAAINGMLTALDPHSSYLDGDKFKEMRVQTRGQFGGLGIQVTMEDGLVKVISPIDDTPAFRAGIQPGDFISHLDNEPVTGMTLNDAVERMRGEVGTPIVLTVRRGDAPPFEVTLTRAIVRIQSVRWRLEGDIGYIRITQFTEQTEAGLQKAVAEFEAERGPGLQGIVLDLRNNPGGLLDQAIAVSDVFLDRGEIVSTRSRKAEDSQRFNARPGDLAKGLPLVVLINGGSASASEIVAGALQDHRRAVVLGTRSFGKGSVQTVIPLGQDGAMRLTTSRYYTPAGTSIQAVGIHPDIEVEQAVVERTAQGQPSRREADLRGALDRQGENGADGPAAGPEGTAAEPTVVDYQLERALDLIRGVTVFRHVAG